MKPKEYIRKYKLDEKSFFDQAGFVEDLYIDFATALANASKSITPITFMNTVDMLYVKWNNIFIGSKVRPEVSEKFWKFFYATKIIPCRNIYFPDYKKSLHEHRMKTDKGYAIRYQYKHDQEEYENFYRKTIDELCAEFFKTRIDALRKMAQNKAVVKDLEFMGINKNPEEVEDDEIKASYRNLSLVFHPDVNKSNNAAEMFDTITKVKDRLLTFTKERGPAKHPDEEFEE